MLCWEYVCTLSISSLYLVDKCWQDIIVDMSWNICYKLWVAALRRIRLPVTSLGLMARTPWKPGIPWLCRQWRLGFGVGRPRSVFWEAFHVCACCLWLDGMTVFFERHIKIIKHIWISVIIFEFWGKLLSNEDCIFCFEIWMRELVRMIKTCTFREDKVPLFHTESLHEIAIHFSPNF